MQDEQLEILQFLQGQPAFAALPEEVLHRVATAVDVRYFKAGSSILEFGQPAESWFVVRSGAVEVFRRDGTLYNRLTEGGHFGEAGLLQKKKVRFPVMALEDTLLYLIPEAVFTELFDTQEAFADQVETEDRTRLRQVVSRREESNQLMSATVETLIGREPVTLPQTASALEAARCMTEAGVSSLADPGQKPAARQSPSWPASSPTATSAPAWSPVAWPTTRR